MLKHWEFSAWSKRKPHIFCLFFVGFTILSNIKAWTGDILTFLVTLKKKSPSSFLAS